MYGYGYKVDGDSDYGADAGRAAQAVDASRQQNYADKKRVVGGTGGKSNAPGTLGHADASPMQTVRTGVEVIYARVRGIEEGLDAIVSRLGGGVPKRGEGPAATVAATPCGGVVGEVIAIGNSVSGSLDGIDDLLGYLGKLVD